MGWRRFACAGALVVGGCASTPSADPPAPVAVTGSVAAVPSTDVIVATTAPAVAVTAQSPSPMTCAEDAGGVSPDEPPSIDDWVVGAERLPSGDVRLIAAAATGQVLSLGCMSGDTADASRELGLSLASVRPVAEGVRVVIAIPAGRQLVPLPWLEPRSGAAAAATTSGFEVHVFLASDVPALDATTPSVAQLAGLVTEAFDDTSTVAGLAPDILEPA